MCQQPLYLGYALRLGPEATGDGANDFQITNLGFDQCSR